MNSISSTDAWIQYKSAIDQNEFKKADRHLIKYEKVMVGSYDEDEIVTEMECLLRRSSDPKRFEKVKRWIQCADKCNSIHTDQFYILSLIACYYLGKCNAIQRICSKLSGPKTLSQKIIDACPDKQFTPLRRLFLTTSELAPLIYKSMK